MYSLVSWGILYRVKMVLVPVSSILALLCQSVFGLDWYSCGYVLCYAASGHVWPPHCYSHGIILQIFLSYKTQYSVGMNHYRNIVLVIHCIP